MSGLEQWRDVVGYGGVYQVSSFGRVRRGERLLSPSVTRQGYHRAKLSRAGRARAHRVHRLVMAAFVGPAEACLHVAHGDGDPGNNRLENLRYCTATENAADKLLHGTHPRGERSERAKLTRAQVRAIRSSTAGASALSRRFGVSRSTVRDVVARRTWAWLVTA